MNTFVLNTETSSLSVDHLLKQVVPGGVEVRDAKGNVLALVLPPADHVAWTYAQAHLDIDQHKNEVQQALKRQGGVTTSQLMQNVDSKAANKNAPQ